MSIGIGARDIGYQSEFYDCDFFIFLLDFPGSSGNGILTQRLIRHFANELSAVFLHNFLKYNVFGRHSWLVRQVATERRSAVYKWYKFIICK